MKDKSNTQGEAYEMFKEIEDSYKSSRQEFKSLGQNLFNSTVSGRTILNGAFIVYFA
jgi:hypothetical protein